MRHRGERVRVKRGFSRAQDEAEAVRQLAHMIEQPDSSVVVFFASSHYDEERLGTELRRAFQSPIIGCTTSGEITPIGYDQGTLSGFSIASDELEVHPYLIPSLHELDGERTREVIKSVQEHLAHTLNVTPEARTFGLLFIDGLSVMEEQVVAILANAVGEIPVVGGSAGDDLEFERTCVYSDGAFISDAAVFSLFITTLPFAPIKTQHFAASEKRLVITRATPENRVVHEINGRPAAEEYARVIGMEVDQLEPMIFSAYPVMLRFGGDYYVRSIQKVNDDGSLTFFCAIDEGLVLRIAEGKNLVDNLEEAFDQVRAKIPKTKLTIGFDCILRRLEVQSKGLQEQVNDILSRNNVVGFSTYGEQFNCVHVNQTFTGIALGE